MTGATRRRARGSAVLAFAIALLPGAALAAGQAADAQADAEPAALTEGTPFKATFGVYRISGGALGFDVNLRYSSWLGNLWAGYFDSNDTDQRQGRVGWDRVFVLGPVRVLPTAQWASGGFLGGAVAAEVGLPWFIGGGYGRTNEKPYVNLNFDPNDAWLVSGGHRGGDGSLAMLQWIIGDRIAQDQQVVHAIYRRPLGGGDRLTLDVFYKHGPVDDQTISKVGASVGYDWPRFFVRVAWDPKVNFTPNDMWRMQVGMRF
jgi:hypothetical protein